MKGIETEVNVLCVQAKFRIWKHFPKLLRAMECKDANVLFLPLFKKKSILFSNSVPNAHIITANTDIYLGTYTSYSKFNAPNCLLCINMSPKTNTCTIFTRLYMAQCEYFCSLLFIFLHKNNVTVFVL